MSGIGIGYAMICVSEEAIKGAGRTKLLNWLTAMDMIVGVGLLVALVLWGGLIGASLSLSLTSIIIGLVMLALARQVVVVPSRQLVSALVTPLPAFAVAAGITWLFEHYLMKAESRPLPIAVGFLLLDGLVYSITYLAILSVFAKPTAKAVLRIGLVAAQRIRERLHGPVRAKV
jgi:PST family polysaccharide transporter